MRLSSENREKLRRAFDTPDFHAMRRATDDFKDPPFRDHIFSGGKLIQRAEYDRKQTAAVDQSIKEGRALLKRLDRPWPFRLLPF